MKNDIQSAIKKLNRMITRQRAAGADPHWRSQGSVLRLIFENDGITASSLASKLDIRRPSLTEKLNRLEEDGSVVRRWDRQDMRVVHLYITDKGRRTVERHSREKGVHRRTFHDCLSEDEKKLFCELCERMSSHIHQMLAEDGEIKNDDSR